MIRKSQIQEHMEVVDSEGRPLGHVDQLEGADRIRLNKNSPKASGGEHIIPVEWVCAVDGGRLRLDRTCAEAERAWSDRVPG